MNFSLLWLLSGMYLKVLFFSFIFLSTDEVILRGSTLSSRFSFWRENTTSLADINWCNMLEMIDIHCSVCSTMRFITPGRFYIVSRSQAVSFPYWWYFLYYQFPVNSVPTFILPVFCTTYIHCSELFRHSSNSSMKYTSEYCWCPILTVKKRQNPFLICGETQIRVEDLSVLS